jgi:hypothetical protein
MDRIRRALLLSPAIAVSGQVAKGVGLGPTKGMADAQARTFDIQHRIDVAAAQGGGVINLPSGRLPVLPFVLKSGVILRGTGKGATNLVCVGSGTDAAVSLGAGPIRYAGLQSLSITNDSRNCGIGLKFVSQPSASGKAHGGLWWSAFSDLEILGFDCGLSLEGGGGNFLLPHQFVTFERIYIRGTGAASSVQLKGQVNQVRFRDSMFELDRQASKSKFSMIDISEASSRGDPAPKVITFDQCTFQQAAVALSASRVQGLQISSSWFENNGISVTVSDTIGLSIEGCRFANAGDMGAAVQLLGRSQGSEKNNVYAGEKTQSSLKIDGASRLSTDSVAVWGAKL